MPNFNALLKKRIGFIILCGLLIRTIFSYFFAELYFNRPNIYVDGDTQAWALSFQNLIENGIYTLNLDNEYGYFGRMPGYSFFLGIFWLIIGNWDYVYPVVGFVQIILDVFAIWLVYKTAMNVYNHKTPALISSALYAFYPFIIVWNPVCYSESVSVFLMIASLYFLTIKTNKSIFISGVFLGVGILFRPQLLFLVPLFSIAVIFISKKTIPISLVLFIMAITITYGLWPIRNYLLHKKFILTQDLRGINNWDTDVLSFMQYTYSVKAEWEPQFSSIIYNSETAWPKESYRTKKDSLLLDYAVSLSKNCGFGFSHWKGYWKKPVKKCESCSGQIASIYNHLRNNQILYNSYNYWIVVPINNFKKAVFKSSLNKNDTTVKKLASLLFYFRSFLIICGLFGIILMLNKRNYYSLIFASFLILLYFSLCIGTSPQMRNIEIRYFLHADILLLFPAAYLFSITYKKFQQKR